MTINTSKIEKLLADNGMTKTALATASGLTLQSVSTILAKGRCSTLSASKIIRALNCTAEDIT